MQDASVLRYIMKVGTLAMGIDDNGIKCSGEVRERNEVIEFLNCCNLANE